MNLDMRKDLVLVADSDREVALSLVESFEELNLDIAAALTGKDAGKMAFELKPKTIVMEVELKDISGFDLCKRLSTHPKTARIPVVFYTARDAEIDVVVGFELGAADYVSKTVSSRELALRIHAILKRAESNGETSFMRVGRLVIDFDQAIACYNEKQIHLSPTEFQILAALAKADGRVLSRREIIATAWPGETSVLGRTVDAHIKSLRVKIADATFEIATVRGVGYCFRNESAGFVRQTQKYEQNKSHQDEEFLTSMNQPNTTCRMESGR